MKQTKTFRRLLSLVLIVTMLMSMAVVGLASVSAAEALTLSYSFKYANAGYAEGQVTLTASSDLDYDKYTVFWADDTKALEGYAPITTLNLNKESVSFTFGEFTAIPAGATKLIAVESALAVAPIRVDMADAVFDIPESKQFKYSASDVEYNFQALSDIHIQHDDSYWVHSKSHWANALEVAAQRDAEFVAVCGDQVNGYGYSNLQKEWPQYLQILADSSFTGPVFETNGNHEIKGNGDKQAQTQDHDIYKIGSGLNVETGAMQSNTYYEMTAPSGDHFLFMTLEKSGSPNEYSEFSDEQLDWLEGRLNAYKNDGKKVVLFQHALIKGYGAGDDLVAPYYGGALVRDFADVKRFTEILEANKNVIWFSGHSHIDFKYNYNINNMNGTTAYTVHIPSCSSTTHPNTSTGTTDYIMSANSSQGWFVDMYKDAVVLNGTDLVKNEILPLYTYMVDYSGEELIENGDYEEEETEPTTPDEEPTTPPYTGETVDIYFSNNKGWENVYVYAFYGVEGGTATGEPLGKYPGAKMTLVGQNDMNQDVYSIAVPADIDYIKFCDGSASNNRTNNIPNEKIADNVGFYLTTANGTKWEYDTYVYAAAKADVAAVGADGYTVYAINSAKWDTVCAYYWGNISTSWPGDIMEKTGETVNGFDVYSITFDREPGSIIFNNNDKGSQTDDLTFQAGKYYDIKEGAWYDSLADVPAVSELSTDRYLVGSFNGWSTVADEFKLKTAGDKVGYVELELAANTTYEFKIVREGKWTSCKDTLNIVDSVEGLTFSSSVSDNTKLTTTDAGTYVFAFGIETSQLQVTYPNSEVLPTVTVPEETDPIETDPVETDPVETDPVESDPIETNPVADTVTIYFTNSNNWADVYIYGFYGVEGEAATGEPLGTYPGTKMTFVEKNELGQDIYSAEVPADIDYIKFVDGTEANNRTNNIPKDKIADNAGFYISDSLGGTKWDYGTYTYEPTENTTVSDAVTDPATGDEPATTATPDETEPAKETVTIYFSNNRNWENVYIYGFYGVEGEAATGEPLGTYPGTKMTFVEKNELGQDIYSAEVPADIDYIKFADGTAENNRTNNIPKDKIADRGGFYLTTATGTKWDYDTYFVPPVTPATDDEPTTATVDTTPTETKPAVETVKIYFSNNKGWENVYIYGFYGVVGESSSGEPLGTYPGTKMTFVEKNGYEQDIYSAEVPADIDYIKFVDGSAENNRTDNIPNALIGDNVGFYLTELGAKYWGYETYTYNKDTVTTETQATETEATETKATETQATETEATESTATETKPSEPAVTILCGDTDMDGKITVKDATTIQKVVADIAVLTYNEAAADVDASGVVNVKDATMIQKYVADIIDKFPLEDTIKPIETNPTETEDTTPTETEDTTPTETEPSTAPIPTTALGELLEDVKATLKNENYYASYVAYAGLKKAYFEYKDADIASMSEADQNAAIAEINTALDAYNTMKKNNPKHVNAYKAPEPGLYLIRGTMNNWDESGVMTPDGDGVSITYTLAAGEHKLKVYDTTTGKWYGNNGQFNDSCSAWTMTEPEGDLLFTATGGTYKFTVKFVSGQIKLTVNKQ